METEKRWVGYLPVLAGTELFAGIAGGDVEEMLHCLSATEKRYSRREYLYRSDSGRCPVGVVLSGSLLIVKEDYFGNRSILERTDQGELFGEAFAGTAVNSLPVSVVADTDSDVLWLDYKRMVSSCSKSCPRHARMIENMVEVLAEKNLMLTRKMEHITKRTTREKLLSYLAEQAQLAGENKFRISFNREQLADYLAVERSAMSAELSKMQKDGLIRFHKNEFELLA